MTINGWDISTVGGRQWTVRRGYSQVSNKSEWTAGSATPVVLPSTLGFKTMQVVILIKALNKEAVQLGISTILAKLLEPADIVLDGMTRKFYGYLKGYSVNEATQRRSNPFHTLTLNMEGFEYSTQVSASGSSSITVNNPGTVEGPAVLTVVPTQAAGTITISGLGDDIKLKNVVSGTTYIVNGETGVIKAGNNLADMDIWTLPVIQPGSNTITLSSSFATATVAFKPRYM